MSAAKNDMLQLRIGTVLRSPARQMTRERMRRYVDVQDTVAYDDGRIHAQPPTIHDDDEYARSQGLSGIIADGMVSTNWIFSLLIDVFGQDAIRKGKLRTKYILPIYEDQTIISFAEVKSVEHTSDQETTYFMEVWCEADGKKVTVGESVVFSRHR
jgi:3-hydroxybutyryl-CoA dehydratase